MDMCCLQLHKKFLEIPNFLLNFIPQKICIFLSLFLEDAYSIEIESWGHNFKQVFLFIQIILYPFKV